MQYTNYDISINYKLNQRLKHCNYIMFTSDLKRVFNIRSGNEITTENNMKKGFWLNRKFYRLDKIKDMVELIPKYEYDFNDTLTNL